MSHVNLSLLFFHFPPNVDIWRFYFVCIGFSHENRAIQIEIDFQLMGKFRHFLEFFYFSNFGGTFFFIFFFQTLFICILFCVISIFTYFLISSLFFSGDFSFFADFSIVRLSFLIFFIFLLLFHCIYFIIRFLNMVTST